MERVVERDRRALPEGDPPAIESVAERGDAELAGTPQIEEGGGNVRPDAGDRRNHGQESPVIVDQRRVRVEGDEVVSHGFSPAAWPRAC